MNPVNDIAIVKCLGCSRSMRIPAGRHRRSIRLQLPTAYFCSRACNCQYVSQAGRIEQDKQIQKAIREIAQ